ncbi:hypothetical protein HGRIS_014789 [Hohenbuehelia grisea]|uniref:Uncharacterized protein n=1 Tax=Hohenbuehelia grisea TaxID=104357 RepID=A0ABR3IQR0_9AGAR
MFASRRPSIFPDCNPPLQLPRHMMGIPFSDRDDLEAATCKRFNCPAFMPLCDVERFPWIRPRVMQLNDMVCVLFGGPMPFILHQGATPSENKLREEAFVNELMKGKVVELWRAGELECKDFRLRHSPIVSWNYLSASLPGCQDRPSLAYGNVIVFKPFGYDKLQHGPGVHRGLGRWGYMISPWRRFEWRSRLCDCCRRFVQSEDAA